MDLELVRALASVRAQTDSDLEILVVDDASTDSTAELLRRFPSDGRLRVLRNFQNLGVVASRNRGLHACRGKFISILDADDSLCPDKVKSHAEILEHSPDVAVVWGQAELVGENEQALGLYPETGYRFEWDLVSPYQVVHSATTWRRSSLIAAGMYDESLYCEEAPDMFLKVGDHGEQLYVPQVVARKTIKQDTDFRNYFNRNLKSVSNALMKRTLQRRYPGRPILSLS